MRQAREMAVQCKNTLELIAISGAGLACISQNKDLQLSMMELLVMANSVVFVRMSPSQKSQVIDLAKKMLDMKVLAIGDGYNDT